MLDDPMAVKALLAGGLLAFLWLCEGLAPMFAGRRRRLEHAGSNLALGALNAIASSLIGAAMFVAAAEWSRRAGFGLLHRLDMPWWAQALFAVVLFDAWHYLCHRACHHLPLLWRLHAIHHSDKEVDASTAMRFHTVEIALTATANAMAIALIGMTVPMALLYELILLPVTLFHHSNVRIAEPLDRALRWLIVTPRMHWVHHSDYQPETDSNFASIFSIWDRLFGSYRVAEPTNLSLGLRGYTEREWRSVQGMLTSPLRSRDYDRSPEEQGQEQRA